MPTTNNLPITISKLLVLALDPFHWDGNIRVESNINKVQAMALPRNDMFDLLPTDMDKEVLARMTPSTRSRLVSTCKSLFIFGKKAEPSFKHPYLLEANKQLKILMKRVRIGSNLQVEEILKNDSGLLLETCDGFTPLQLAYKDRDVEMCKLMKPFFEGLCANPEDGIRIMRRQLHPAFLASLGAPDRSYSFKSLLYALKTGGAETALATFRTEIDDITKKEQFPIHAYLHALSDYNSYRTIWGEALAKRFCKEALGYLQRAAPPWMRNYLLKRFLDGYKPDGEPAFRDFKLYGRDEPIHPCTDEPNKGLGFEYCLTAIGESSDLWRVSWRLEWEVDGQFKSHDAFFKRKIAELDEFTKGLELTKDDPEPVEESALVRVGPGCTIL